MPLDHTSLLKTIEQRWNIPALTARDAAAPGFGDVLTLTAPRTDDVLAGVTVPVSGSAARPVGQVSHLEAIRDELAARYAPSERPPAPAPAAARIVQDPTGARTRRRLERRGTPGGAGGPFGMMIAGQPRTARGVA